MEIFNKNSFRFINILILSFICTFVFTNSSSSETKTDGLPKYKAAILIEAETGKVLKEYKSKEQMLPASIVKMMLLLLDYEAEKKGTF